MEDSQSQGDSVTEDRTEDVQEPDTPDAEGDAPDAPPSETDEPDTFDRAYVEKLRQENGKYRQRAQRADDLAHRLHRALVEQTGRLQDPSDLPFDEDHLGGVDKMVAAIDELLTAKPHLAARRVTGDVGQGVSSTAGVNLADLMRNHT